MMMPLGGPAERFYHLCRNCLDDWDRNAIARLRANRRVLDHDLKRIREPLEPKALPAARSSTTIDEKIVVRRIVPQGA